ncbi:DMT family transporter [Cytobacillus suaedae]|nr:DMT family transporter [Cytobacillus suaedae]
MSDAQKGHLFNLLSVFMIALGPLFSKFGLLELTPAKAALINALTILLASFVFGLVTRKPVTIYFEKSILLLSLFNSLGVIFLFLSINLLSPVEIGFIGRFYTVFAVLLSVFLLKEKLSKREMMFIIIAIAGVFLFVDKGGNYREQLPGTTFAVLYTFFFALTNVFIKKTMSTSKSSNSILFTNNSMTFLIIIVYSVLSGELFEGGFQANGIGFIILSSLFAGFGGTILLYEALKYLRFSIANVTRAFSPLLLAVISFPFFPIEITLQNTVGAIVLAASIFMLSMEDKQNNRDKKQPSSS